MRAVKAHLTRAPATHFSDQSCWLQPSGLPPRPGMKRAAAKRARDADVEPPIDVAATAEAQTAQASSESANPGALQRGQRVLIQGFAVTDLWLKVPLDHFSDSSADQYITVFAREVRC